MTLNELGHKYIALGRKMVDRTSDLEEITKAAHECGLQIHIGLQPMPPAEAEQPAERDVGDDLCWELGDILLGYLDRLNDPTEDDPLEKIVRELRAEASPIVDQILAEGPGRTAEIGRRDWQRIEDYNEQGQEGQGDA